MVNNIKSLLLTMVFLSFMFYVKADQKIQSPFQILNATLTMAVSPEGVGSTYPEVGSSTQNIGDKITVIANEVDGFTFSRWVVSGVGKVENTTAVTTSLFLFGNATVTAIYQKNGSHSILKLESSPDNWGSTDPAGIEVVANGEVVNIKATPITGAFFEEWRISGSNAVVTDTSAEETTAVLTGDETITAVFALMVVPVTLKMAVYPDGGGTVEPDEGEHIVTSGTEEYNLTANEANNFRFTGWTATDGAIITDPNSKTTTVTFRDDAVVTANFVPITNSATLTMAVTPTDTGTTDPAIGNHSVQVETETPIRAYDTDTNFFTFWSINGNGVVAEPYSAKTTVKLNGNATVTANFASFTPGTKVILTMAVSPDSSGTVDPSTGNHEVTPGDYVTISAEPVDNTYYFAKWTISGNGSIMDIYDPDTQVVLSDNATVTANFNSVFSSVNLTMAVSPENSGSCDPSVGIHSVAVGAITKITAEAAEGYHFTSWTVPNEVNILDRYNPETKVIVSADATITANFTQDDETASLTMAVSPENAGSTNPGTGISTVQQGQPITVEAFAATGYKFYKWIVDDNVLIDNAYAVKAVIRLTGDGEVKAIFTEETPTAILTMNISPENQGFINPDVGTHEVHTGVPVTISALPVSNWEFAVWTTSGNAVIINPFDQTTSVIISGNSTVTAYFYSTTVDFVSIGSFISLRANEIGEGNLNEFTTKPSVWAEYTNPVSGKTGKKAGLKCLGKVSAKAPQESLNFLWQKKIRLYNKNDYRPKDSARSNYINEHPIANLFSDNIYAKASEYGTKKPILIKERTMILACPAIAIIRGSPQAKDDKFTVEGMFFGIQPPKVYLECTNTSRSGQIKYRYLKCPTVKNESLVFSDANGKPNASCMKILDSENLNPDWPEEVGFSKVVLLYPRIGNYQPTGYLILDNGVGLAVSPSTIEESEP